VVGPAVATVTAIFDAYRPSPRPAGDELVTLLRETAVRTDVRLLCMTPLERKGGGAEFLAGLAHWASLHPDIMVELVWAADGTMRTLLAAQPIPSNLVQRFVGCLDGRSIVDLLRYCQAFVMPARDELSSAVAIYALLSGMHVFCGGSKRGQWDAFRECPMLHHYSRHRSETSYLALSEAFGASAPFRQQIGPSRTNTCAA
jgi:hypothetical protein